MGKYDLSWGSIMEAEAIGRSMGYSKDDILTLALAIEDSNVPRKKPKKPVPGALTKYYKLLKLHNAALREVSDAIDRGAPKDEVNALIEKRKKIYRLSTYYANLC